MRNNHANNPLIQLIAKENILSKNQMGTIKGGCSCSSADGETYVTIDGSGASATECANMCAKYWKAQEAENSVL